MCAFGGVISVSFVECGVADDDDDDEEEDDVVAESVDSAVSVSAVVLVGSVDMRRGEYTRGST